MKTYRIMRDVECAVGTQSWLVKANSEADAIERYNNGEGEFEEEEVEITGLGKPYAELAYDGGES